MMKNFLINKNYEIHFYKMIAIFLSFGLWFYVMNSEKITQEKSIQLMIKTPTGTALANIIDDSITLKITGARAFLSDFNLQQKMIVIDLKKYYIPGKEQIEFNIDIDDVIIPFGIEVLDYYPKKLTAFLQKTIIKKVPLKGVFVGKIRQDLKLIKKEIIPRSVMIEGPLEIMRRTSSIETLPIFLNELQGEGVVKVFLSKLDARIKILKQGQLNFELKYITHALKSNLSLKNIPIRVLSSRRWRRLSVKTVGVDILVKDGQNINAEDISIWAEIPQGPKSGKVMIELKANLPKDVHLLRINPQKIEVYL